MNTSRNGDPQELYRKVMQRRVSAGKKKLATKAILIARYLGFIAGNVKHAPTQRYDKDGLRIDMTLNSQGDLPPRPGHVKITHGDKLVFDEYVPWGEIKSYIPGPWEKVLRRLHTEALKEQAKRAADDVAERKRKHAAGLVELASRFGL